MNKKWLFISFLLVTMMVIGLPVSAQDDATDLPVGINSVDADCRVLSGGEMDRGESFQFGFECSQATTVYFGVCDGGSIPNDDLFDILFRGEVVAYNSYSGDSEIAHIGSGSAEAGRNVATLRNLQDITPFATYIYSVSPNKGEVENDMQSFCAQDLSSIAQAEKEEILAEEVIPDVMPGDVITLENLVKISEDYPTIYYRATWDTGVPIEPEAATRTSDIRVFDEGGNAVPGETSNGEGFVEKAVNNQPQGTYDVEFEAGTDDFPAAGSDVKIVVATFVTDGVGRRGAIRGMVFEDANLNGVLDEGEIGIGGVDIILETPGIEDYPFYTGEDGIYAPVALGPSYYWVRMEVPEGWTATTPTRSEPLPILVDGGGNAAVDINFGLVPGGTGGPIVPESLPDSGFGPGPNYALLVWLAVGGLLLVGGAVLLLRARGQDL